MDHKNIWPEMIDKEKNEIFSNINGKILSRLNITDWLILNGLFRLDKILQRYGDKNSDVYNELNDIGQEIGSTIEFVREIKQDIVSGK